MLFVKLRLIILDRTKRVKEARDEAKKEIDAYRKQKEEEFKKFETEVCCGYVFSPIKRAGAFN